MWLKARPYLKHAHPPMSGFVKPHMPHVFPSKYLAMVPPLDNIDIASKNKIYHRSHCFGFGFDWWLKNKFQRATLILVAEKQLGLALIVSEQSYYSYWDAKLVYQEVFGYPIVPIVFFWEF